MTSRWMRLQPHIPTRCGATGMQEKATKVASTGKNHRPYNSFMPTQWETVIGLEVHTQVRTRSKMFCACPVAPTVELSQANRHVCPVCLGHPGTLPRPNRQVVTKALRLALKLGCRINERSVFARKNYFYPDLPKGYQISQFDLPLAEDGLLPYWHQGERRQARLRRIHLEEDTAKLFHLPDGTAALDYSRGGVPLIEIVSYPDFRSGEECISYLDELRSLLRRLEVSDAQMESGNMRCEPNVSVRPEGADELRTKTELKNLNSFGTLRKAVAAEAQRQGALYDNGGAVHQATLRYDDARGTTAEMRRKETADDYRYFDDPDLPPLLLDADLRRDAEAGLVASGFELRGLLTEQDGLPHEHAATIAGDEVLHRFYRLTTQDGNPPREVAKWVCGELVRLMREGPMQIEPGALSAVMKRMQRGELTLPQARQVFEQVYQTNLSVDNVIAQLGISPDAMASSLLAEYGLESPKDLLGAICARVIDENPKVVEDYRGGKASAIMALVGPVMKATKGSAKPEEVKAKLEELLK
jgi:aspartyl-tRNA(Asn)/glutamyl-tRNA(Gln) amidotransferase subunit B